MDLKQKVIDLYGEFESQWLMRYGIGDRSRYSNVASGDRKTLNPHITVEADLQVKFGGFLEARFQGAGGDLSVHAEVDALAKPDLSIHRIASTLWAKTTEIEDSVLAVIEIKLCPFRCPNVMFDNRKIDGDIEKMLCLQNKLGRRLEKFLLLCDEGCGVSPDHIASVRSRAGLESIAILSNNPALRL